jgi:hypothetical protein
MAATVMAATVGIAKGDDKGVVSLRNNAPTHRSVSRDEDWDLLNPSSVSVTPLLTDDGEFDTVLLHTGRESVTRDWLLLNQSNR